MQKADVRAAEKPLAGLRPLDLSTTARANAKCHQLLVRAVAALAATDGAIFVLGADGALDALTTNGDPGAWAKEALTEAARSALRAGQPVLSVVVRGPDQRLCGRAELYLSLPLEVDGEILGVLMVTGLPSEDPALPVELQRLGELPEMIALSLDRSRALSALGHRADELTALRRQLDAFALDFRSTYQAERDRAQQLADALGVLERTYRATVEGLALAVEAKDE
ncbi:MAG TPA: hypothetical protein VME46_04080 [Acidimicrobiales bacterium]|nr:hypothetical protein [Acidimicrobiales bacterium]